MVEVKVFGTVVIVPLLVMTTLVTITGLVHKSSMSMA